MQGQRVNRPSAADRPGWYFYQGESIQGPATIRDLLRIAASGSLGVTTLISRVGFERWYTLSDIVELYNTRATLSREVAEEVETLNAVLVKNASTLERHVATPPTQAPAPSPTPKVTARSVGPRRGPLSPSPASARTSSSSSFETMLAEQTLAGTSFAPARPRERKAPNVSGTPDNRSPVRAPKEASPVTPKPAAMAIAAATRESAGPTYFVLKGRLRLGRIRSGSLQAFLFLPLTLGLYGYFWARSVASELLWHMHKRFDPPHGTLPPFFTAVVPGFHIYFAYCLASLIRAAEKQNGYTRTSPALAAFLSILPPLALFYLQTSLNRHWAMHVASFSDTKLREHSV